MEADTVKVVDVAIIGAEGWYGLVAAKTYLRLRPDAKILIIDSDSTVGGVWSKSRLYPNLVAQVKIGFFNYSDTPMPANGATKNNLVTGDMIHNYLEKYASDHDLLRRIRFRSFVERAQRCSRGWRLSIKDSADIIETEKLMVATGVTSIPNMPGHDAHGLTVPVIHSKDLGSTYTMLATDKVEDVVVVGAAKSAYDAVYLLVSMGKRVTWIIRPSGAGPLAILPSDLLGYFNSIAVASTRLMSHLSPSILNTGGTLNSFFQQSKLGRWCTGKFWDTVTYLSNRHAGYNKEDHVAGLRPEIDEKSVFWANSGLGVVTLPDFWATIHAGDVKVVRDDIVSMKENTVLLGSGKSLKTDFVVMCTGWGDHFAIFDHATKAELGLPLYSDCSPLLTPSTEPSWEPYDNAAERAVNAKLPILAQAPRLRNPHTNGMQPQRRWRLYRRSIPIQLAVKGDRSLAIMGQIHTVQTPLVSDMQSFWSILYLLGELDLPDEATMAQEIAEWNAWTRKRYLSQGQKYPYSLYDFLPYIDSLCKDLGINSRRKGNALAELFSPYKPEDFNGFIEEYLVKNPQASKAASDTSINGKG